uniref:Large ribosomal subunit protein uL29m n=1 Tax=Denticeps clupeoides TaxID=299321 RepID=A0AAY4BDT0_9TELE
MAATVAGRVANLCRHFQRSFAISPPSVRQQLPRPPSICSSPATRHAATLHTSAGRRGLGEFFDDPENWGESTVKSGAPWTAKQLRTKSNEDLHKLWYVLLKEKNMLLTLEQESKRQLLSMPSPERMKKVDRSLRRLDTVVQERETAIRLLQTGQERARPGAWRKNVFGKVYWYRFREYAIPWYLNTRYKRKRFFTPSFVNPYTRLSLEKHLRAKVRKARLEKQKSKRLDEMFSKTSAKV